MTAPSISGWLRLAVRGAIAAAAGLVCIAVIGVGAFLAIGHRPVVIQTGSMGDTAPPGSLVVARPVAEVAVGDVLILRGDDRATVTHRVVDIEERPDGLVAVTHGDANPDIDPEPYPLGSEELTARWVVPDAGGWLLQVRDPLIGLTLLVGVVGTLTFVALRRIWAPRPPVAPVGQGAVPPPPPTRRSIRDTYRAESGRRRRAVIISVAAGAGVVLGGAVWSVYLGVDSVAANQFSTRPCFDARLGSVQSGQFASTTQGTDSVAITAVDPARSFLLFSASSDDDDADQSMIRATLDSAISIRFDRDSGESTPSPLRVEWSVIEYDCGVSVQRGVVTSPGASTIDVSLPAAVDTGSSFALVSQAAAPNAGTYGRSELATVSLTSSTDLRIKASDTITAGVDLSWQVVTFDGGDISTQELTGSLGPSDSTVTVTIPTPVDTEATAILTSVRFDGITNDVDVGDRAIRARLVDATTVELSRSIAAEDVEVVVQVVEFRDGTTVRRGVLDLAATEAVATATIPPVQTSRSTATSTVMVPAGLSGGSTVHSADDTIGEASARLRLVDERTVEVRRDSTDSAASFAWQVITWNGPNWADLDQPFRQRIDVAGGAVVTPTGYTTPLTLDHAQLVADDLSLPDGSDLRVWRHDGLNWSELHRVLDDESTWNTGDSTVWFRTQESIAADVTATYWLYFGDDTPDPVLDDPEQVWLAVESFDDGTLGIFEDRTGGTAWYDDEPWRSRVPIQIDGAGLAADVLDTPVLIDVTDPDLIGTVQDDASDVRFTAGDATTPLPHQVESWNPVTGALTAWVRVPAVTAGATTTIHLHHDSPSAPDQSDPRTTWAGRQTAWLLSDDPTTARPALDDDGPRQRDGVALADATAGAAPAGGAVDFDGALDRLESQPFALVDGPFTISTWFRADTLPGFATIVTQGDPLGAPVIALGTAGDSVAVAVTTTDETAGFIAGSLAAGAWHHVTVTWDRTTLRLYIDGAEVADIAATGQLVRPGPAPVTIGADPAGGNAFDGTIAHVEIDSTAWSPAAIEFAADVFAGSRVAPGASTTVTDFEQGTWSARWPITVDADSVAGTATLDDFPLLVRFTDPSIGAEALANGNDLVFTAADGTTRLDHWIEDWDAGSGDLTAWVRIPELDGVDDTRIYLYAGNATANDQRDPAGVWGPAVDLVVTGAG